MANVLTVANETKYLVVTKFFEQTAGADVQLLPKPSPPIKSTT